ncbi:hypothetical protein BESB_021750 [Besnoitia besnoiti]|uniref:Bacterial alpha-2-macroglobulin MG10 domain-containing protein n=1 Tax=Besnoitia besnoiti TaxID=94643 RepID=A0A2A9M4U4_BESBE|nr:hypothetical protein BESB_021750 [Besnoitia besnoiti]PFH32234.1 hypothetical protein BESB_021750 [Besnoitia besnoiti]
MRDSITAVVTTHDLLPGGKYILTVRGNVTVRDKFDQPLQASTLAFRMDRLQPTAQLVLPRQSRVWFIDDPYLRRQLRERNELQLGTAVQFGDYRQLAGTTSSTEDTETRQVITSDFGACLLSNPEACLTALFDDVITERQTKGSRNGDQVPASTPFPDPRLVYSYGDQDSPETAGFSTPLIQPLLFQRFTTTSLFLVTVKSKEPFQPYMSTSHFLWGVSRFLARYTPTVMPEEEQNPALLVQALDLETAYPLNRSKVYVYGKSRGAPVVALGTGITDVRGFALVPVSRPTATMRLILVVAPDGYGPPFVSEVFGVPDVWIVKKNTESVIKQGSSPPYSVLRLHNGGVVRQKDLSFVLLSDRGTYRPGESIQLYGFLSLMRDVGGSGSKATTLVHQAFGLKPADVKIWLQLTWRTKEGRGGAPFRVNHGKAGDELFEGGASGDSETEESPGAGASRGEASTGGIAVCSNIVTGLDEFGSFVAAVEVPTDVEHNQPAVIDVGVFERGRLKQENAIVDDACMKRSKRILRKEILIEPTIISMPNIVVSAPRRTSVFLTDVTVPPFVRCDDQLLVKGLVKNHDGVQLNGQQVRLRFTFEVPAFLRMRLGSRAGWWTVKTEQKHTLISVVSRATGRVRIEAAAWTRSSGSFAVSLDLSKLLWVAENRAPCPLHLAQGTPIEVEVECQGLRMELRAPFKEVTTVANTPLSIGAFETSITPILPGVPFVVTTRVVPRPRVKAAESIQRSVVLEVFRIDPQSPLPVPEGMSWEERMMNPGLASCPVGYLPLAADGTVEVKELAKQPAATLVQRCDGMRDCYVKLPVDAAQYLFIATLTTDQATGRETHCEFFQANHRTLASQHITLKVRTHRDAYTIGDTVRLRFFNPFNEGSSIRPTRPRDAAAGSEDNTELSEDGGIVEANVSIVWNTPSLHRHSRMVPFHRMDAVEISAGRVPKDCPASCSFMLFITMPMSSQPLPLMQLDLSDNALYPSSIISQNPIAHKHGPFYVKQEVKVVVTHPLRQLQIPKNAITLRVLDSRGEPAKTFDKKERVTVQLLVHKGRLAISMQAKSRGQDRASRSSRRQGRSISIRSVRRTSASVASARDFGIDGESSKPLIDNVEEEEVIDLDEWPFTLQGHVLLTVVDKRFLDIRAVPLVPLADKLQKAAAAEQQRGPGFVTRVWNSSLDRACSYEGFQFINQVKERRRSSDPWFEELPWPISPEHFFNMTYSKEYLDDTAAYDMYAWPLTGVFRPKHVSGLNKVRISQRGLFMAEWQKAVKQQESGQADPQNPVWDVSPDATLKSAEQDDEEVADLGEDGISLAEEDQAAPYELRFLPRAEPVIGWRTVELTDVGGGLLEGSLELELPNEAAAHVVRAYSTVVATPQLPRAEQGRTGVGLSVKEADSAAANASTGTQTTGVTLQDGQERSDTDPAAEGSHAGTTLMVDSREQIIHVRKSVAVHGYAPPSMRLQDVAMIGVTLDGGSNMVGKEVVVTLVSTTLLTPLTSLTPRTQRVRIDGPTQVVLFPVAADRRLGTAKASFAVSIEMANNRLTPLKGSFSDLLSLASVSSWGASSDRTDTSTSDSRTNASFPGRRFKQRNTVKVTIEVLPNLRRVAAASLLPVQALNIPLDDPRVAALGRKPQGGVPIPREVVPGLGEFRVSAGTTGLAAILYKLREVIQTKLVVHKESYGIDRLQRPYTGSDLLIILFGEALMRKAYGFEDLEVNGAADRARLLLPGFYPGSKTNGFLSGLSDSLKGANARVSLTLTMLAVFVGDLDVAKSLKSRRKKFVAAVNRYIRLLATRWNQEGKKELTLLEYVGPSLIGTLRFVLGSAHKFGLDPEHEDALSMDSLLPHAETMRADACNKLPARILWALAIMKREGSGAEMHSVAYRCVRAMLARFRRSGIRGYIALDVGTDEPTTNTVHSLMLLLLTSSREWTRQYSDEIQRLMVYLYGGGRKPPRVFAGAGLSRWSLALLFMALEQWDRQLRGLGEQSVMMEVQAREPSEIDGVPLIDDSFGADRRGPTERVIGWKELEKKIVDRRADRSADSDVLARPTAAHVVVLAIGRGMAFVSTFSDFVPSRPLLYPSYEGCLVQKRYHLFDSHQGYCKDQPTLVVRSGDRVCVSITVTFKSPAKLLTVRDLLPAGLEPLDDAAEGFFSQSLSLMEHDQSSHSDVSTTFLEGQCRKRISGQSLEWVCQSLCPGTHNFAVLALANIPGFYAVSLANAVVHVASRHSLAAGQAEHMNIPRTLLGTSGAAEKAFAVLPLNYRSEDEFGNKGEENPFTAAGLPTVRVCLSAPALIASSGIG